jgi:hypothetical protein
VDGHHELVQGSPAEKTVVRLRNIDDDERDGLRQVVVARAEGDRQHHRPQRLGGTRDGTSECTSWGELLLGDLELLHQLDRDQVETYATINVVLLVRLLLTRVFSVGLQSSPYSSRPKLGC